MSKNILSTENEVKERLGIKDFRSINKNQLIEFVSSIPDMDKEIAIKCIEQFPVFKDMAETVIVHFHSLCETAITDNNKETIEYYQSMLNSLNDILKADDLSEDMKKYIIDAMVEIGNQLANVADSNNRFKETVIKIAAALTGLTVLTGSAILGVKILKK